MGNGNANVNNFVINESTIGDITLVSDQNQDKLRKIPLYQRPFVGPVRVNSPKPELILYPEFQEPGMVVRLMIGRAFTFVKDSEDPADYELDY